MLYEKTFPITGMPGELLLISWERSYKNTRIFHGERELKHVEKIRQLKNGVVIKDEHLGRIEIELSEKPMGFEVIVDGYHSSESVTHPLKRLKGVSKYFMIFAIACTVYLAINLYFVAEMITPAYLVIEILAIGIYTAAALLSRTGYGWAVIAGFVMYCLVTLAFLLIVIAFAAAPFQIVPSYIMVGLCIFLIIRTTFIVLMAPFLKLTIQVAKYRKLKTSNKELLDENLAL